MTPELSFDGFGINGPDEYRTRLATFRTTYDARHFGPLFAASPDMHAALIRISDRLEAWAEAHEHLSTVSRSESEIDPHANRAANYRELIRIARDSMPKS